MIDSNSFLCCDKPVGASDSAGALNAAGPFNPFQLQPLASLGGTADPQTISSLLSSLPPQMAALLPSLFPSGSMPSMPSSTANPNSANNQLLSALSAAFPSTANAHGLQPADGPSSKGDSRAAPANDSPNDQGGSRAAKEPRLDRDAQRTRDKYRIPTSVTTLPSAAAPAEPARASSAADGHVTASATDGNRAAAADGAVRPPSRPTPSPLCAAGPLAPAAPVSGATLPFSTDCRSGE